MQQDHSQKAMKERKRAKERDKENIVEKKERGKEKGGGSEERETHGHKRQGM